ncbi:uncharacterized protein [Parasteatoda tepidariorum]|uniref:uncharacterized protein isoform X2 n=1 Tax=Parasteatoda tepidariorum TaxID=114398 RepID=UPI001C720212|nr:uncharacterized protein LOC107439357 [Parasteatoda tepidariorum]
MTDEIRLVFVGAPLLDICAKCDKNTLKKFGLKRDDGIKASKEHEELIQQLFNDSNSELSAGGSAQNSARIAKWILGSKSRVSFIGCTGNDSFERWLKEKLILDGVAPLYVQSPDLKTGICACLIIDESERSMICQHEASATLRAEHLEIEDIKHDLAKADIIFVEGYFIAHSPDVVLALAKMKTSKQVFSLSLSAEYICKDYSDILLKVLPRVDILFGNEVELKALATALGAPLSITVMFYLGTYGIAFQSILLLATLLLFWGAIKAVPPLLLPWLCFSPFIIVAITINVAMTLEHHSDLVPPLICFAVLTSLLVIYAGANIYYHFKELMDEEQRIISENLQGQIGPQCRRTSLQRVLALFRRTRPTRTSQEPVFQRSSSPPRILAIGQPPRTQRRSPPTVLSVGQPHLCPQRSPPTILSVGQPRLSPQRSPPTILSVGQPHLSPQRSPPILSVGQPPLSPQRSPPIILSVDQSPLSPPRSPQTSSSASQPPLSPLVTERETMQSMLSQTYAKMLMASQPPPNAKPPL